MATIRSSGASQSTIKLVATNLIANGRLSGNWHPSFIGGDALSICCLCVDVEGVQLLCLIDKGLDACRYLQSYDEWDQAAWLAKVRHCSMGTSTV